MTKLVKTSLFLIAMVTTASTTFAADNAGKKTYDQACAACHTTGVAGAPKNGDVGAWAARVEQVWMPCTTSAIKGKGAMPAKGGQVAIPDAEIKSCC